MRALIVVVVLFASAAAAHDMVELEAVGWTKDSRYFVYREHHSTVAPKAATSGDGDLVVVLEVKTGKATRYFYGCGDDENAPCEREKKKFPGLPQRKAYESWLTGTEITGRSSDVEAETIDARPKPEGPPGDVHLEVRKKRVATWSAGGLKKKYADIWPAADAPPVAISGDTHGSPDGKSLVWVKKATWDFFGPCGSACEVVISEVSAHPNPDPAPVVQIVAHESLPKAARDAAMAALTKAGFQMVTPGPAQKARDKSVVYAAKGMEARAAEIAKAVPGGATVEPLTWKADVDVVVALGESAR